MACKCIILEDSFQLLWQKATLVNSAYTTLERQTLTMFYYSYMGGWGQLGMLFLYPVQSIPRISLRSITSVAITSSSDKTELVSYL
jgi:hypothetical protein